MKQNNLYPITLLLVLFLSTPFLNAQDIDSKNNQPLNIDSYITLNLFSSIDPFNPRWRVGYINNINPHWKLGVEFGYGSRSLSLFTYEWFTFGRNIEDNYQLWEVRPELYYVFNPNRKSIGYVSSELFYIHHTDIYHNDNITTKNNGFFKYESANYRRQKYGFLVKSGIFINTRSKIGLNIYTGLGFRFRNNTLSNIIEPIPYKDRRDMIVIEYNELEGLYFGFNYSLGFRLFYKF